MGRVVLPFVVFQFRPKDGSRFAGRPDAAVMDFREFAAACKNAGLTFFANQEITRQCKWLIVKDFKADTIKNAVAPYLGAPDEIRYRIGGRILTVKKGKDGNQIRIFLQNAGDEVKGGQPPEAARVW